jgi:hypothetical protein
MLLKELLAEYSVQDDFTDEFKTLKHDKDIVPKFTENLRLITKYVGSYSDDCYDIQGVKDSGIDILLKYMTKEDGLEYIGLQIKSYDDIKNADWLSKLKAQMFDANTWRAKDVYIVFCTDSIEYKKKIRNATAELLKGHNRELAIINPNEALGFYKLSKLNLYLSIYSYFHKNDPVNKLLKRKFCKYNNFEIAVIIEIAVEYLVNNDPYLTQEIVYGSKFIENTKNEVLERYNDNELPNQEEELLLKSWDMLNDLSFVNDDCIKYNADFSWEFTGLICEIMSKNNIDCDKLKEYIYKLLLRIMRW